MSSLYETGIRPIVDAYIDELAQKERDYGEYWSASSAGYCMRLNIMRRLKIPMVPELEEGKATRQRIFSAGDIFHEWLQAITKKVGVSIAQEVQLQDEDLMIRGHFDDLVLVDEPDDRTKLTSHDFKHSDDPDDGTEPIGKVAKNLILYDFKTAHSASFKFKKGKPIGHYHKYQLGTYMYMIRTREREWETEEGKYPWKKLSEARILTISKDDLRMNETQLMWSPNLEKDIVGYWKTLNGYWKKKVLPRCTCLEFDGGFLGKRSKKGKIYNDYMYKNPKSGEEEPCSLAWAMKHRELLKGWAVEREGNNG